MLDNWVEFGKAADLIDARVTERVGKRALISYSAYPLNKNDTPMDNLDEVAFKGKGILFLARNDFCGGPKSADYQSEVVENPTWLDLCPLVEQAIKTTNDKHHIFFEGITKIAKKTNGVSHYQIEMGS